MGGMIALTLACVHQRDEHAVDEARQTNERFLTMGRPMTPSPYLGVLLEERTRDSRFRPNIADMMPPRAQRSAGAPLFPYASSIPASIAPTGNWGVRDRVHDGRVPRVDRPLTEKP